MVVVGVEPLTSGGPGVGDCIGQELAPDALVAHSVGDQRVEDEGMEIGRASCRERV